MDLVTGLDALVERLAEMKWFGWLAIAYPLLALIRSYSEQENIDPGQALFACTLCWMLWWVAWH